MKLPISIWARADELARKKHVLLKIIIRVRFFLAISNLLIA
jgi:hypothetical protein